MLKWPTIEPYIAAVVVVGFFGGLAVWDSYRSPPKRSEHPSGFQQPTCENAITALQRQPNPACPETDTNKKHEPVVGYWAKFLEDPLIGLTGALAVATALLVIAVIQQIADGRKSSERQLRAYISVRPRNAINVYPEKLPKVDFIIENTGQTPAYNVRHIALAEILEHPLLDHQGDLVTSDPAVRRPNLAVHSHMQIIGDAVREKTITFDEWANICAGKYRFYLAGLVLYDDVFGIERKTKFCAYIGGPEFQRVATLAHVNNITLEKIDWTFSHVHNEST